MSKLLHVWESRSSPHTLSQETVLHKIGEHNQKREDMGCRKQDTLMGERKREI